MLDFRSPTYRGEGPNWVPGVRDCKYLENRDGFYDILFRNFLWKFKHHVGCSDGKVIRSQPWPEVMFEPDFLKEVLSFFDSLTSVG